MEELNNLIWNEKYRPNTFDELILKPSYKEVFKKYKKNKDLVPSFIFHSNKPGTGKTSTARVLKNEYDCDFLEINSSEERGIDTIREKISLFVRSVAFNDFKKCVFLDEADGLTPQAQDSLRNLMETYSSNCFFILSCNNLHKVIEPLRSRCTVIKFETPDEDEIFNKLVYIVQEEKLNLSDDKVADIIQNFYPDIRSMVSHLQHIKFAVDLKTPTKNFEELLQAIENKNSKLIYKFAYEGSIDLEAFNKWLFKYLFDNCDEIGLDVCKRRSLLLADNERAFNMGINKEIIFVSNMLQYE